MSINAIQVVSVFFSILLAAGLVSTEWSNQLDRLDALQMRNYFGENLAHRLNEEAEGVFEVEEVKASSLEREPGAFDWIALAPINHTPPPKMAPIMTWIMERWSLLNAMVHRSVHRMIVVLEFKGLALLTIILFLIDGVTAWNVRRVSFSYTSSLAHRTTLWLLVGFLFLLAFAVIAPVPFFPALIPIHLTLVAWLLRMHLFYLPKRL